MAQTSTTTTHGALLKELYTLPPVRALNDKSFLHDKLAKEQAVTDISGKYILFPVTLRRSLGRGARAEEGTLPVAVSEVLDDARVTVGYDYYALEWSEASEEASKNREGAFEKVVTMKMKNVAIDMAKHKNRQWYNTATPGVLATATADDAAGLTITVDSTQYIEVGDLVDIYNGSSVITNGTQREVASKTATSITINTNSVSGGDSGNVDSNTGYVVYVTGSYNNEPQGLRAAAAVDRTLHAINSTTYENWDGYTSALASAVAGESSFEILYDAIGAKGRGDIDTYITTRGVRRRLADEFASQRRYLNEKATDIKAGYRLVEVNGVETVIDDDCPKGYVFGFKRDNIKVVQLTQPGFLETEAGDGAYIELKNSSTAGRKVNVWQAWYRYHCALAFTDPATVGSLSGAADD